MTQSNPVPVAFREGLPSDAAIRFDAAINAALYYAQSGDDVRVMSLAWDAWSAALTLGDRERMETVLHLWQCAIERHQSAKGAIDPSEGGNTPRKVPHAR